ncbi:MAG TPA: 6-carboxytetrahydropterin synthase [Phycisphaerales bacterium]|nr:6-carboxytetrahydropterin synthase [Phycisphaerales bacterium]
MVELCRTVRFSVNPAGDDAPGPNRYAGSPPMRGLGRHYELDVACVGEPDAESGYLLNVKDFDAAVRRAAVPIIARACRERPETDPGALLPGIVVALREALPVSLARVRWRLTPYHGVEMHADDTRTVLVRQRFELAASHRLHVASWSDERNRECFGKCNSPHGHGHNYIVEPCVAMPPPQGGIAVLDLAGLERLVVRTIVDRFDHKHLNLDTPEFNERTGVIPSVENIARVFHGLLEGALREAAPAASLRSVTVWESDRTSATFPA